MSDIHFQPPDAVDPLGDVLHMLRLNGTLYCRADLYAPWGVALPQMDRSMLFIVILAGEGWMRLAGREPVLVREGSMVVLPQGTPVDLVSAAHDPAVPLFDLPATKVSERYEMMTITGPGPVTRAMTGVVSFDDVAARRLVDLLPEVLVVDRWHDAAGLWLRSTLDLISHEASTLKPGGEAVITRLADILIIQAIRGWLDTAPEAQTGWLAALRDAQLGRALAAIHKAPGEDWTLERLARLAGMSRSGFAARFSEMVRQPAMRYLTEWRMQKARMAIVGGRDAIGQIARNAGYQSEAAFGRAFKQTFGESPGSLRKAG
ncbi:AraC family transcriptional regulator [Devosia sediminis]|uniref:AraC family transcriptional regulator n=1 Tax=Devosia sediminis TaxID=2798801 RepID=A0A934IYK0_9HYPH|nr:AraC family transcriptional regulator [Devosia sediminis]MBJ3784319.1 AraC family transcriptional regulator [Devosia sediminis]